MMSSYLDDPTRVRFSSPQRGREEPTLTSISASEQGTYKGAVRKKAFPNEAGSVVIRKLPRIEDCPHEPCQGLFAA